MSKKSMSTGTLEGYNCVLIEAIFNPTVDMAAEIMNVPASTIVEWLSQEHYPIVGGDRLSNKAIDFLASKYVSRLHTYFDNCMSSWDSMDLHERDLFDQFRIQFGHTFPFWVNKWKDIDKKSLIRYFRSELAKKADEAFCAEFNVAGSYSSLIFVDSPVLSDRCYPIFEPVRISGLLTALSHSIFYGIRIKTELPSAPDYRNILLEILQENRFHIFTGDADSDGSFDAFLNRDSLKQPQIAITPVFGYSRHKNALLHEKVPINSCC